MHSFKHLAIMFFLFVLTDLMHSQGVFSPEIGFMAGPVQFRSDYGQRENEATNFGNSGFGIGIMGYLNFSYRRRYNYWNRSTYIKEHFKIRGEISWNKTELDHYGEWVKPSRISEDAKKLRAHKGATENFDLGFQIEYSPFSIKGLESFTPGFYPFVSLGLHYTFYTAEVSTNYSNPNPFAIGNVLDPSNFYSFWEPGSIKPSSGSTHSLVTGVGLRYKLNKMNDIMLELRGQYYFSDWVDGLNHQLDSNKYNDWLIWLNIGYIAYFD